MLISAAEAKKSVWVTVQAKNGCQSGEQALFKRGETDADFSLEPSDEMFFESFEGVAVEDIRPGCYGLVKLLKAEFAH